MTTLSIYIHLADSILEYSCECTTQDKDAYRRYRTFFSVFFSTRLTTVNFACALKMKTCHELSPIQN